MQTTKENIHYCASYFMNPTHPITVALIGAGGTGSFLISRLARLDFALRQLNHPGLHVTLYDGDIIEPHNVGRQNFTLNEIGQYKASTMIEKVNFAYGLDWEAFNIMVKPVDVCEANILITAVDNAKFRMGVHKLIKQSKMISKSYYSPYNLRFYWLDCGNGKDFGQVVLSTMAEIKQPKESQHNVFGILKSVVDIYGDLEEFDDKEHQGIESCSFVESVNKQDLFINDTISTMACDMLWKLCRYKYIAYNGVVVNHGNYRQVGIPIR